MRDTVDRGACSRADHRERPRPAGGRRRRLARRLEGAAYRLLREPLFVALVLFKRFGTRRDRE